MIKAILSVFLRIANAQKKKKVVVYLLDHPLSSHRYDSSDLIGFGGASPTVFIQTKETSGCLVSFVENDGVVGNYNPTYSYTDTPHFQPLWFKTLPREINELCVFHIRFGNADYHDRNTLSKILAQGMHHFFCQLFITSKDIQSTTFQDITRFKSLVLTSLANLWATLFMGCTI